MSPGSAAYVSLNVDMDASMALFCLCEPVRHKQFYHRAAAGVSLVGFRKKDASKKT
jgi:hypothetical protein